MKLKTRFLLLTAVATPLLGLADYSNYPNNYGSYDDLRQTAIDLQKNVGEALYEAERAADIIIISKDAQSRIFALSNALRTA